MSSTSRPFRVWSADRQIRKSMVATNLKELKENSAKKLGAIDGDVNIVLEYDGTKIEDDDYLSYIEDNTVLILLRRDEKWSPKHKQGGHDETDSSIKAVYTPYLNSLQELALLLRQDLAKIVLFSQDQLQVLVDAAEGELSQLLGGSLSDTQSIQATCQRYLDDKRAATDALNVLDLLKQQANKNTINSQQTNSSVKKQRIE